MKRILFLFVMSAIVVGCTASQPDLPPIPASPTALLEPVVEETAVSTSAPAQPTAVLSTAESTVTEIIVEPTLSPTETAVAENEPAAVVSGRTEEGAYFLGDPKAPITLTDYSDFL
jgi:hypothetical protein